MSQSKNPNGRPKGSSNKVPSRIKERLAALVEKSFTRLQSDFESLTPKERLEFIAKILPFIIAKARDPLDFLTDEQIEEIIERIIKINEQNEKAA